MSTERAVQTSYVDLPAILIGTILALAISTVFAHFGAAIGLSINPDMDWEREKAVGQLIAIGLWFLWLQILSSIAGGYVSGRMRRAVTGAPVHEREVRDGVHGLLVWATATVLVTIAAALVSAFAALVVDANPDTAERTQDMIELQKTAGIILAFSVAATSLVSAVAAWWAGTLGGEHRDENIDHSRYVSFRKK